MPDDFDLDARLGALFGTPADEFVAARDALVRDLKQADRDDDATAVKALKRPTVAVVAVNRAAREHPDDVARLVDLGAELAALQGSADADRDELRRLTRDRRGVLTRLTDVAARTTERPDGARNAIAATLDAASLDDGLRDALVRGRITHELAPVARFVAGDATSSAAPAPRRPRRAGRDEPAPRDELAARRARTELAAVRERADAADEALREHADVATDASADLEEAQRRVTDLEAALANARADVAGAKRAEREAQRAEQRARTEQERASAALRAAERAAERDDPAG